MIIGKISPERRPLLPIRIYGTSDDRTLIVPFLLDTGFEAELTLPDFVIEALRLQQEDVKSIYLGDGSEREVKQFRCSMDWDDIRVAATVLAIDEIPVIGMRLLYGRDIFIKNSDGGPVLVI